MTEKTPCPICGGKLLWKQRGCELSSLVCQKCGGTKICSKKEEELLWEEAKKEADISEAISERASEV